VQDLVLRILGSLSVAQLCGLSGVSRWARRIAGKDALWKALYLERWDDPSSHAREREALLLGWKKIYEQKDTAMRKSDEEEEAMRSAKDQEDEECQEAFRAMQAAQRSQALQKKHVQLDRATKRSAMDVIQDAIQEFKSHCHFPHPEGSGQRHTPDGGCSAAPGRQAALKMQGDGQDESPTLGSSMASSPCPSPSMRSVAGLSRTSSKCSVASTCLGDGAAGGACKGAVAKQAGDEKEKDGRGSLFGHGGFYTSYTAGHLRNFLRTKLNALPRQHQLEVCVCKLTGKVHVCSRDSGACGCELAQPNDDGFFVCPITGIIWESKRHFVSGVLEHDDDDGDGEQHEFEGGSKSFCNMVRHWLVLCVESVALLRKRALCFSEKEPYVAPKGLPRLKLRRKKSPKLKLLRKGALN